VVGRAAGIEEAGAGAWRCEGRTQLGAYEGGEHGREREFAHFNFNLIKGRVCFKEKKHIYEI
jgi:hypothetical protein